MQITLGYIMLIVQNLDASVAFYQKLLQKSPDYVAPRWGQFSLPNAILGLKTADIWSDPEDPLSKVGTGQKGVSFILAVENLEVAITHLERESIPVVYGPRVSGLGKMLYVIDPDGYYVQICEGK